MILLKIIQLCHCTRCQSNFVVWDLNHVQNLPLLPFYSLHKMSAA